MVMGSNWLQCAVFKSLFSASKYVSIANNTIVNNVKMLKIFSADSN